MALLTINQKETFANTSKKQDALTVAQFAEASTVVVRPSKVISTAVLLTVTGTVVQLVHTQWGSGACGTHR